MSIQVTTQQNESIRVRPYFPAMTDAVRRVGNTLRSFGRAFFTAMEETQSARAARFIREHSHLIDNYK